MLRLVTSYTSVNDNKSSKRPFHSAPSNRPPHSSPLTVPNPRSRSRSRSPSPPPSRTPAPRSPSETSSTDPLRLARISSVKLVHSRTTRQPNDLRRLVLVQNLLTGVYAVWGPVLAALRRRGYLYNGTCKGFMGLEGAGDLGDEFRDPEKVRAGVRCGTKPRGGRRGRGARRVVRANKGSGGTTRMQEIKITEDGEDGDIVEVLKSGKTHSGPSPLSRELSPLMETLLEDPFLKAATAAAKAASIAPAAEHDPHPKVPSIVVLPPPPDDIDIDEDDMPLVYLRRRSNSEPMVPTASELASLAAKASASAIDLSSNTDPADSTLMKSKASSLCEPGVKQTRLQRLFSSLFSRGWFGGKEKGQKESMKDNGEKKVGLTRSSSFSSRLTASLSLKRQTARTAGGVSQLGKSGLAGAFEKGEEAMDGGVVKVTVVLPREGNVDEKPKGMDEPVKIEMESPPTKPTDPVSLIDGNSLHKDDNPPQKHLKRLRRPHIPAPLPLKSRRSVSRRWSSPDLNLRFKLTSSQTTPWRPTPKRTQPLKKFHRSNSDPFLRSRVSLIAPMDLEKILPRVPVVMGGVVGLDEEVLRSLGLVEAVVDEEELDRVFDFGWVLEE
ncbi:hypothetical protein HDV00_001020 [Rhizophlyctis rosea]|nr:hypothetical protein HDV00_001020 [Rhizophlyctis rosea]